MFTLLAKYPNFLFIGTDHRELSSKLTLICNRQIGKAIGIVIGEVIGYDRFMIGMIGIAIVLDSFDDWHIGLAIWHTLIGI